MAHYERRDGGWSVRWRDPDGTNRRRQCPDAGSRDRLVREIEGCQAEGRRWEPVARRNPSVAELCDEYLREHKRTWAANTYADRDVSLSIWQAWVEARVRRTHIGIETVSRSLLGEYWDHLREQRKNAVSTANLRVQHVEQWWAWCYDHEEHGAVVPRPRTLAVPAVTRSLVRAPTWAEMDLVIGGFQSQRVRRLAVVMRCTGLRISQALGIRWDDLDLTARTLELRPELGKTRSERRGRRVPIAPVLADELAGWGVREGPVVDTDTDRDHYTAGLRRGWARSGVPEDRWSGRSAHAFRKGFVTGLRLAGADRDAVEYLVGHDLGLAGVYTDAAAYRLTEAVALVPAVATNVRRLRAAEEG